MAYHLQSEPFHLGIERRLLLLNEKIQRTRFPAESIGDYVRLPGMIVDGQVVIFDQLHPAALPHIQLPLSENVLETLVIGE